MFGREVYPVNVNACGRVGHMKYNQVPSRPTEYDTVGGCQLVHASENFTHTCLDQYNTTSAHMHTARACVPTHSCYAPTPLAVGSFSPQSFVWLTQQAGKNKRHALTD